MELRSGGTGASLTITEQDGSPSGVVSLLKVSNGTLTDNGGGTFSLITGGGGGSGISSINGDTTADQTLVVGSSGTDFTIVDNLSGQHTFNIPTASASNRGLLSSTDWSTFNGKGTVTSVSSANTSYLTVANPTTTPVLTVVSAPILTTARTIGGVSFDGSANITVASATGGFTISGGDLALGANNITMTGSLGATGARLTKGWFTDLQVTNAIVGSVTGNAGTATALQNARTIGGVSFDGTANITVASATGGFTVSGGALTVGVSLSSTGQIILKNSTNTNTLTIQSGPTSASYTLTLPTAVASAGQVLTDVSGNGVLSFQTPTTGTVTAVSVVTANGFAGSSSGGATPALTLTTTITGILKGNGTAIAAASAGTDYLTDSSTNTLTNKTFDTAGTGNVFKINGTQLTAVTGSGTTVVLQTSPTLVTPVLGVATATSINLLTITSSTGTLTIAGGKTFTVNKTITLTGTDSTTMTFPSTSASVARTDAAQTFTGIQTFSQVITTSNAIAASGNAATVPITSRINTVTNNSAATLTITMTTASAVDGQLSMVRVLDASSATQSISWVNTENSSVTVPSATNGSTTLPLTVGFSFNNNTAKWRCIATA